MPAGCTSASEPAVLVELGYVIDWHLSDRQPRRQPDNKDTSLRYQERFAAAVPDEVVGRSLDEAEVGVLADLGGCADGFNDAIAKIREQASTGN